MPSFRVFRPLIFQILGTRVVHVPAGMIASSVADQGPGITEVHRVQIGVKGLPDTLGNLSFFPVGGLFGIHPKRTPVHVAFFATRLRHGGASR